MPAPYSNAATGAGHIAPAAAAAAAGAGVPTAAGTDDDGSHASDGFCITRGEDALIESSEASVTSASASAATTHGTLSNPLSPNYDTAPAARESPTVPSMGALAPLPQPQTHHQQQQQQHRWDQPILPRKAISSHIAGTGTFMVMYQRGHEGGFDCGLVDGPVDGAHPTRDI